MNNKAKNPAEYLEIFFIYVSSGLKMPMQPWKSRIARHHRNVNYIHKFRYSCAPPPWMLIDVVGKFITRAWGLRGRKTKPFYRMHLKENVNYFLNIHNFYIICDDRPVDCFKTEPLAQIGLCCSIWEACLRPVFRDELWSCQEAIGRLGEQVQHRITVTSYESQITVNWTVRVTACSS